MALLTHIGVALVASLFLDIHVVLLIVYSNILDVLATSSLILQMFGIDNPGLVMAVVWSVLTAIITTFLFKYNMKNHVGVFVVVFSHWIVDVVVGLGLLGKYVFPQDLQDKMIKFAWVFDASNGPFVGQMKSKDHAILFGEFAFTAMCVLIWLVGRMLMKPAKKKE